MPQRNKSNAVSERPAKPVSGAISTARILLWASRSDIRSVLAITLLFTVGMSFEYLFPADWSNLYGIAKVVLTFLVFGVFLGVVVVTVDNEAYRASGNWIRAFCGALALAAIAVLLSAPWKFVALAALVGVALGFTASYWARYA